MCLVAVRGEVIWSEAIVLMRQLTPELAVDAGSSSGVLL